MKIAATISPALLELLAKDQVDVDYIEVNGESELATLERACALRPVLLHDISYGFWLNYQDPFDDATMSKARAMLDLARPPWHSTGIGASAEPQGHTTPYWRGAPASALQPREVCLANIVRNGKRLKEWVGIPLLLAKRDVIVFDTVSNEPEDLGNVLFIKPGEGLGNARSNLAAGFTWDHEDKQCLILVTFSANHFIRGSWESIVAPFTH